MQNWDDSLRICPKCKFHVRAIDEPKTACPQCGSQVWFYNFRQLPPAPDLPGIRPRALQDNPILVGLLVAILLFGLIALIGIGINSVVVVVSGFAVVGASIFAFIRHHDAETLETAIETAHAHREYAETMRERVREVAQRYNSLLRTGDSRVEHYFNDIYSRAENIKTEAESLRIAAKIDRDAVANVERRIFAIAEKLIDDHRKWITQKLRPDPENYLRRKLEIEKAFDFVESVGYRLPTTIRKDTLAKLKDDFANVMRQQSLKDEQRRLQQQMRDEEKIRREAIKAVVEAESRELEIQRRLERAILEHKGETDVEVQELKRQLAEAQARAERAQSMAQLTKVGHVYILSNIGSFGECTFKVGMTRRLDPEDRVRELGDASVPFPFDVHAMISCDNAPALENTLHRELTRYRVNRINLRKEFFRVDLNVILNCVRRNHGEIEYVAEPEALQYREGLTISPDELVEYESELESLGFDIDDHDE